MSGYISAILKDKLTNEDITKIISKYDAFKPDYMIPGIFTIGFSASFGMPGNLKKIGDLKNNTVMVANLSAKSGERGIIQLAPKNSETPHEFEVSMSELDNLLSKTGIKERLLYHEIYVNFVRERKEFKQTKEKLPNLKTIKNPRSFGLRIFEGELPDDDIRTQPWKQINIEPVVQDPTKLSITIIFRNENLEQSIISNGYEDVDKLLDYLKEE